MATVTIGTVDYPVYADLDQANDYLSAESGATAWRAETDDDVKRRALVSATRTLDRLAWPGERDDPDQDLAWPRSGTGLSGVEDDVVPQQIIDATCVLAMLIVAGTDVAGMTSTSGGEIKRQKAGSVEQEFFRAFDVEGTPLPTQAWDLIAPLLGGPATSGGAVSFGTDRCSDIRGYEPSGPY